MSIKKELYYTRDLEKERMMLKWHPRNMEGFERMCLCYQMGNYSVSWVVLILAASTQVVHTSCIFMRIDV